MALTTVDFQPTPLSPQTIHQNTGPCHMPSSPRPVKTTSGRVSKLLFDNLELLSAPSLGSNVGHENLPPLTSTAITSSNLTFVLQPRLDHPEDASRSAFLQAIHRLQGQSGRHGDRIVLVHKKARRVPTLPVKQNTKKTETQHQEGEAATDVSKEHSTGRIPITGSIRRSNSGLALSA